MDLAMLRFWNQSLKPNPHRESAANAGLWWRLGMGLGPIFKRHPPGADPGFSVGGGANPPGGGASI